MAKGVQLGYFAQHQLDTLHADESALWHMQKKLAPEQTEQQVRDYLGSFAFHGDKVNQAVKSFLEEKSTIGVGFDCLATPEFITT